LSPRFAGVHSERHAAGAAIEGDYEGDFPAGELQSHFARPDLSPTWRFVTMARFLFGLLSVLILAGCAASDQEAIAPQNVKRPVVSQSMVPVSYDESGNPFITVKGEKIGVDFDGPKPERRTEFLVTESIDPNGRTVVSVE
jgi:hypothetical protein